MARLDDSVEQFTTTTQFHHLKKKITFFVARGSPKKPAPPRTPHRGKMRNGWYGRVGGHRGPLVGKMPFLYRMTNKKTENRLRKTQKLSRKAPTQKKGSRPKPRNKADGLLWTRRLTHSPSSYFRPSFLLDGYLAAAVAMAILAGTLPSLSLFWNMTLWHRHCFQSGGVKWT